MSLRIVSSISEIVDVFEQRGNSEYGGEDVTQIEHALQSATLAKSESASAELISAALLHDFGHLIHNLPVDAPDNGIDDFHEAAAAKSLCEVFPDSVTEPIKLHVRAKRYLCTTDKNYFSKLSHASVTSLNLQGGTMSDQELHEFESYTYWQDALRLRVWDDLAKDPKIHTPELSHFIDFLESSLI